DRLDSELILTGWIVGVGKPARRSRKSDFGEERGATGASPESLPIGSKPLEPVDQRACASGSGRRAEGAPAAKCGMTSAANRRMDPCASPESGAPQMLCHKAGSERADQFEAAGDDGLVLSRRADPGAARGDLAVEGERAQPAHRFVVVAIILGGRASCPIAHRLVERAEIFLERRARDLARPPGLPLAEPLAPPPH